MLDIIIGLVVTIIIEAVCLWVAMKLTKVEGLFLQMLVVSAIANLVSLIPVAGWILSIAVMFFLICKWTGAKFWPDAVLVVIVAELVGLLAGMGIIMLLSSLAA